MSHYRDEKETLRRRVVALTRELERLQGDDAEDAATLAEVLAERDALRQENEAMSALLEEAARRERGERPRSDHDAYAWAGLSALVLLMGLWASSASLPLGFSVFVIGLLYLAQAVRLYVRGARSARLPRVRVALEEEETEEQPRRLRGRRRERRA